MENVSRPCRPAGNALLHAFLGSRLALLAVALAGGTGAWACYRADAIQYLKIATVGYVAEPYGDAGWMPFYPLLIRLASQLLEPRLAGLLVSNLSLLGALYVLRRLGLGQRALLLLLAFPTAFFLSVVYAESTFLLLSSAAFLAARRGRFGWAGLCGALAAVTRPTGLALLPALWLERRGWKDGVPLLLIGLAPLLFFYHLQERVGDFWAYVYWQRVLGTHMGGWTNAWGPSHWLGFASLVLCLVGLAAGWKRMRPSYRCYVAFSLLGPFVHTLGVGQGRYLLVLFPLFEVSERLARRPVLLACAAAQMVLFHLYASGNPALF